MNPLEMRFAGSAKVEADSSRRIKGYAIVFNSMSLDLGGFREIIMPSAVDRTLSEAMDVRALVDHDSSKVIGRTRAGTRWPTGRRAASAPGPAGCRPPP